MRKPNTALKVPVDAQGDLTMRYVDRRFDDREKIAGPAICARCHASLEMDHWRYDESRYRAMKELPDIEVILCPGCTRIERRLYEGEVSLLYDSSVVNTEDLIHLIHNEEARGRATNPSSRIALMEERDDEIYVLTTSQFLARRIGKELEKAFHGSLKINELPRERFVRVRWKL